MTNDEKSLGQIACEVWTGHSINEWSGRGSCVIWDKIGAAVVAAANKAKDAEIEALERSLKTYRNQFDDDQRDLRDRTNAIKKLQADLAAAKEGYRHERNDIEILLDYFRNDMVGSRYGIVGDDKGWSPCQCAVETMKQLSNDWHKAIIERNQIIAERDAALARAEAAEYRFAWRNSDH